MSDLKINNKLSWRKRLEVINAIIKNLKPLTNIEIKEGQATKIHKSEENIVIEIKSSTSSNSLLEGYEETDIILCDNGSPTNGKILFNPD